MIYRRRVFENDEVKPTASSSSSGWYAYLFTNFLQFLSDVPILFCEEWSTSHAGHIAFDDADHVPDFERTDP